MKNYLKDEEWKKLDRGFKVGLIQGTIVGGIFTVIGILFLFFLYVGIIDFGQGNLSLKFLENQQERAFERVSDNWQNNEFVKSLSYICSFKETEKQKVVCVYNYVKDSFNYTRHGIGNRLRESPEEIINESGVCRDYSVMYSSLMSNLNISYEFVHQPEHVYLMVYPENYSCRLDIDYLRCKIK